MTDDPAQEAIRELREHQRKSGIEFENPDAPVAAPAQEGIESWMTADEDLR
jgi:hypothetical protein